MHKVLSIYIKQALTKSLTALLPLSITIFVIYYLLSSINVYVNSYVPNSLEFPYSGIVLFISITTLVGTLDSIAMIRRGIYRIFARLTRYFSFVVKIYKTCNTVLNTLVNSKDNGTVKGALFMYPGPHLLSLGFMTNAHIPNEIKEFLPLKDPAVFLSPTSPNPLTGIVIFISKADARLNIGINQEQVLTVLTSMGTTANKQQITKHSNLPIFSTFCKYTLLLLYPVLMPIIKSIRWLCTRFKQGLIVVLPVIIIIALIKIIANSIVILASRFSLGLHPVIGPVITLGCMVLLGMFFNMLLGRMFVHYTDKIMGKTPFIGIVYNTVKNIIESLAGNSNISGYCALVKYPNDGMYVLGIVTAKTSTLAPGTCHVFIPTTPNPTSGYFVLAAAKDVIPLPISLGTCTAIILSCGMNTSLK